MIEKLKTINPYEETEIDMDVGSVNLVYENTPLVQKINELVDAVNELQKQIDKMSCAILDLATPNGENKALKSIKAESKTHADPYEEQRRWIGKLCRFRDKHAEIWEYGTLETVENVDYAIDSAFRSSDGYWYDICEPVKPDDDIIYKDEQ